MSFGQGLEDFSTLPISGSSYETGNFEGNNLITWSYVNCRGDKQINDKAICFGKTDSSIKSENIPNGIKNFACKVKKEFTSTETRKIELYINEVSVAQSDVIEGLQDFVVNDINIEGDFILEIKNISGGGKQVSIDDIEWTAYGNTPSQSSAKSITSFLINGKSGSVDEGAHTVSITLPESTDVSALAPEIGISEKATIVPASGTSQNFTNPVTYTVTAEDGTEQTYQVTVTLETVVVSSLLINELDCDQTSTDTKEFVELYDGGAGNTSLEGYALVFYNGNNDVSYATYDLSGEATSAEGFFVVGSSEVFNVNLSPSGFTLQNGADAVALYKASTTNFPDGTALTTDNLVDIVVYDTNDADDTGLLAALLAGEQINEDAGGDKDNHSIYRTTDGEGGSRNTTAFVSGIPTPGKSNTSSNDETKVELILSANSGSETEQSVITITANTNKAVIESQTVDLSISGTGITTGDYSLSATQLTILAGESSATASLSIVDDTEEEGVETLSVSLSNPSAGIQLGTTVSGDISITDNDNLTNDGSETSPFTIAEALSLAESSTEYYAYGYIVGVGNDFETPFGSIYYITIADSPDETSYENCLNLKLEAGENRDTWNLQDTPGNLGKQIKFNGFRDTYSSHASFEGNSVIIDLSGDSSLATVTLSLSATSASEEEQTSITISASSDQAVIESQTVDLSISGTGITTGDYSLSATQLTILAGESSATASLSIVDDTEEEGVEILTVSLSNPSAGIQLGTTVSGDISITDNDSESGGSILANYVYLDPETSGDGGIIVNLTPKEYVQTISASHHMNSVKIPEDYYSNAVGLTGDNLRDKIHFIIEEGAQAQDYGTVWDMCEDGDENPKDPTQVWQMYIEEGIAKTAHVSGSSGWNREHTWAKSHGGFGTANGPGTDGHHLRATDAQENSARGSRDFGNDSPGYTPPKSARGDVARMIFYMATRWEMTVDDQCKETESSARHGKLSHLLQWHEEDPVDPYEVRRNNVIYGYQNNRNPFIDHPELVQYIFGEAKTEAWDGGEGTEPSKIKIIGSLSDFGMIKFGEESSVQTFSVSANELTENLTINSPQHFLISDDESTYASSLSLAIIGGNVAETTISVKFVPELAVSAEVTGNIQITGGEESKSVSVSGTEGDPALVPLAFLNEDFESDTHNNWILKSELGDRNWELTEYSSNKYMQMSAYKATGEVVSWLITPALDLDAYNNETLNFKTKNGYYNGTTLEVLISTDFDGKDVSTSTWQKLSAAIDERNNSSSYGSNYIESGNVDLSSYDGTVYIAFKYSGNGSSETTTYQVDDVVVEGVKVPITGTLEHNMVSGLEFPYTEVGANSEVQSYELSFENLEGDITVQATDNYELSLDGSLWSSNLNISRSETPPITINVRFVPKTAVLSGSTGSITHKAKAAENIVISMSSAESSEIADASTLSRDKTLDIVSWNVEWFGAPEKSKDATSFGQQLSTVSVKIIELDADVYAIQELVSDEVNGDFLTPLIDAINDLAGSDVYSGIMGPRYSHDDDTPTTEYPAQRVCYIYNKTTVKNLNDISMFSDLYEGGATTSIDGYTGDASKFWASGRLPYLFDAEISIDGKKENIKFVNIHAKCCQDSHSRKLADAKFLLNELNTNYTDDNLVVLGDYNDYLEGSMTSGKSSPYSSWFESIDYFDHVVTSTTNIDHITISNELYDEYQVITNNTGQDNVSISDHHPILLRLKLRSVEAGKESQTITFAELPGKTYGDAAFELSASSSSGLAVSFELVSGSATLTGNELSITGVGEVTVKAIQSGNENYEAAESVSRTFTVSKAAQTIAFADLENKTYGDAAFELSASVSSGLTVSFELISGPASLSGNQLSITGVGEVTVKAIQEGNENYEAAESVSRTFTVQEAVQKVNQIITFAELPGKIYGDAAFELSASASSGLVVSFELVSGPASLSGNQLSITGVGEVTVKAIQPGNDNYEAAESVSQTFTVSKAAQTIAFADIENKTYGEAFELSASSSSGLTVSFELVSGPASLSGNQLSITGVGEVTVKAIQSGNENYEAAKSVSRTFTVSKAVQTIAFADLENKTYGDAAFELSASVSSGLTVSFELISGPASLSGNQLSITGAGDVTVKAVQAGNENYEAANESQSFEVHKADQTVHFEPIEGVIVVDEPVQMVASSSVGLSIEFEILEGEGSIDGYVLIPSAAGEFSIRAYQNGTENFNSAEDVQSFTVSQPTGIKEVFEEEVTIYPNPASDFVNLDLPEGDIKQILILNNRGQVIKTVEAYEKLRINVQDLISGIYFISIQTDQFAITKRLLVIHK